MRDVITEYSCLAAMMNDPEALYVATEGIFTDDRREIYKAMLLAYAKYGEVDPEILEEFYTNVPGELLVDVRKNPRPIIEKLRTVARKRQLAEASDLLSIQAGLPLPDEDYVRKILTFEPISPTQDVTLHNGAKHLETDIVRKRSDKYVFAKTGLKVFDSMLGGEWPRRSLTIIKARPGVGKTALVTTSMEYLAQNNIQTHFWSLEMAKQQLMVRWLANRLQIDNTRILTGVDLDETELDVIREDMKKIQALPMTVNEDRVSLEGLMNETHYLVNHKQTRVFFFDYLQICGIVKYGNKNNDLGFVAQTMKELAKKYDVSFVVLSQVNDDEEVRDSGEVEQVADVSIFMSPDDQPDTNGETITRIRFDKNRFGPVGKSATVAFSGPFQYFYDLGQKR